MYSILHYVHTTSVILFLLQYLIKTILLLANQKDNLATYVKWTRIPEMVISFIFLATGLYMIFGLPVYNWMIWVKLGLVFASIPLAVVGFKRGSKALAILSLLCLIGAYGLAEMFGKAKLKPTNMKNSTEVKAAVEKEGAEVDLLDVGKKLYINYCAMCHGEDGTLGLQGAANLQASRLKDAEALDIIVNGKKPLMPAYGAMFETPEERNALLEYIKFIRK